MSGFQGKLALSVAALLALIAAAACGSSSSSGASSSSSRAVSSSIGPIVAGTYSGAIACTGSDRFSNGAPTRHYASTPHVAVVFGSGQQLEHWTYLFLGRTNTVIQSTAVKPAQSFTYAAGKHIGRPGITRVTVQETPHSNGVSIVNAILDWSSPASGYIGSGTYALIVERRATTTIRYEAEKVVVKLPRTRPSRANPVVRRTEDCRGDLSS
jgi:hypothetical protein